ncbi:MAG: hypothetical protein K0S47_3375 [Herbinix sp.]|jgi:hypothetical protein|nr:hypothetical protein [Herbinix sp.]
MIRKKSSFLTFIFSLMPGAGEMYMGFMKKGVSIMALFFFLIFLSTWLNLGPLMFIMPLIWFYSFFDVHNLRAMPDDEFYALEDDFLFIEDGSKDKIKSIAIRYRNLIGLILIVIGFSTLWNNLYDLLYAAFPGAFMIALYNVGHLFPQTVVGAAIIALGVYLIRGKKKELALLEDKGGPQA